MNRPANISCYLKLVVADPLSRDAMRAWYEAVKENAPNGVIASVQTTDETGCLRSATLVHRECGKHEYIVPLSRNLTDKEAEPCIQAFADAQPEIDFDAEVSSAQPDVFGRHSPAKVDDDKYMELCTSWAKRQHENWVKEREGTGWRYGPTVSMTNKTHPLMRPWHELPDHFRQVDTDQPQSLLDLLNDQGYAVIGKSELEGILRLLRGL